MKYLLLIMMAFCMSILSFGQNAETLRKANAGDVKAQKELAFFYYNFNSDNSTPQSKEYLYWTLKAAQNGAAGCQDILAHGYKRGWHGLSKDEEQYGYWLMKLAENNSNVEDDKEWISRGQKELADNYRYGENGFPESIPNFIKWAKKSAYNGDHSGAFSLGLYYQDINKGEAIYWYKKTMDLYWMEHNEENETAAEKLRELGVYYHPEDHVNKKSSSVSSSSKGSSQSKRQSGNSNTQLIKPSDFSEATAKFFSTPKTYSVSQHSIIALGLNGMSSYDRGEAIFTVNRNGFSYKLGDGSSNIHTFSPQLKTVTVATSRGDVKMQMYILDDGSAIRAIQNKDGRYTIYLYTRNYSDDKFVQLRFFILR